MRIGCGVFSQFSSVVEQRFCKPSVVGSNPTTGSINGIKGFKRVWSPRNSDEFLRVLENFPVATHDDEVDALSGAHSILAQSTGTVATVVHCPPSSRQRMLSGGSF